MKAIIMTLFIWATVLLVCCASQSSEPDNKAAGMQGWEIIGQEQGCTLYRKMLKGVTRQEYIYWSICRNGSGSSISTSIFIQ